MGAETGGPGRVLRLPDKLEMINSSSTARVPDEKYVGYGSSTTRVPDETYVAYSSSTKRVPDEKYVGYGRMGFDCLMDAAQFVVLSTRFDETLSTS